MSAGVFQASKYQTDNATIWPIKIQPETLNLVIVTPDGNITNTAPTDPISGKLPSVRVGGGRKGYGLFARGVRFKFVGEPPTNYKPDSPIFLPILKFADFQKITKGSTGTYLTKSIVVIGTVAERVN